MSGAKPATYYYAKYADEVKAAAKFWKTASLKARKRRIESLILAAQAIDDTARLMRKVLLAIAKEEDEPCEASGGGSTDGAPARLSFA